MKRQFHVGLKMAEPYIRPGLPGKVATRDQPATPPEPPAVMIEFEPGMYVNQAVWTSDIQRMWRAAVAKREPKGAENT